MVLVGAARRPQVLILVFSRIASDSRVLRQVRSLSEHYDVTSAAFGPSPIEGVRHVELTNLPPYKGRFFGRLAYVLGFVLRLFPLTVRLNARNRAAFETLRNYEWDLVVANDVETLPLALRLKPKLGILSDVHEYSTRQDEHSWTWRTFEAPYFRWLVKTQLPRAKAVTTVSGGLAREYLREFAIRADVVTNASAFQPLVPNSTSSPIRLVHSGVPAVQRRLELMIDAVKMSTADVTLDLYLIDDASDYLAELKSRAVGEQRIRFLAPVDSGQLVSVLNDYDVGLCVLPPTTFNLAWCLPNKFFDYVQARLGVIVGPSPEMKHVVEETGVGRVSDDFTAESLAAVLDELDPTVIAEWKKASHANAEELSSGPQTDIWRHTIDRMLGGSIPTTL